MITINAHGRKWVFGDVVDGEMQLSNFGTIVRDEWLRTAELRRYIVIDRFIVMPNHFHAIIALIGAFLQGRGTPRPYDRDWIAYRLFRAAHHHTAARCSGVDRRPIADPRFPTDRMGGACPALEQHLPYADPRLEQIDAYVQGLYTPPDREKKNATLSDVIGAFKSAATRRINALQGTPGAPRWQRSFHDHAIRDALDLELHRNYIETNPRRWARRYGATNGRV
jgi:hypothetical protein